jgi:hypothetical protein
MKSAGRYPGVQIVGTYSPPHGPLDAAFYNECRARITTAQPDIAHPEHSGTDTTGATLSSNG